MSDFSRSFLPWEDFKRGLYLAGVECKDGAEAPEGWTKWVIPGYEYIYVECESGDTFSEVIAYMKERHIPLAGAVNDFTCPQTGKNYMFFPIRKLSENAAVHDGVSPIVVEDAEPREQFLKLFNYLVPPSGAAKTAQGELIRIAGRVEREIWDNGCINWDDDFRKMLRAFVQYLSLGNPFSEEDIRAAEILVTLLKDGQDLWDDKNGCGRLCSALCSCAVAWVQQNPEVVAPLKAEYSR